MGDDTLTSYLESSYFETKCFFGRIVSQRPILWHRFEKFQTQEFTQRIELITCSSLISISMRFTFDDCRPWIISWIPWRKNRCVTLPAGLRQFWRRVRKSTCRTLHAEAGGDHIGRLAEFYIQTVDAYRKRKRVLKRRYLPVHCQPQQPCTK